VQIPPRNHQSRHTAPDDFHQSHLLYSAQSLQFGMHIPCFVAETMHCNMYWKEVLITGMAFYFMPGFLYGYLPKLSVTTSI
jgi:hypothetical protein